MRNVKQLARAQTANAILERMNNDPLREDGTVTVPAMLIPGFRQTLANERGVQNNILIKTFGGLGDLVCAEPTIRFALETFKDCDISIATERPELFGHLSPKEIIDLNVDKSEKTKTHYVFQTLYPDNSLQLEFMSPLHTHAVDYFSLCAFRCQIPVKFREIQLRPSAKDKEVASYDLRNSVVVHAGRHWGTNTMPKDWWDRVISRIKEKGATPVLIGKDVAHDIGTVDIDTEGCVDLRNRLKLMETVALLQRAKVVLTNDSSPLHMAASGDAWIGFLATAKHPDHLKHWRHGSFGWRMQNFTSGGAWDLYHYLPNNTDRIDVDKLGEHLNNWLPQSEVFADWATEKLRE